MADTKEAPEAVPCTNCGGNIFFDDDPSTFEHGGETSDAGRGKRPRTGRYWCSDICRQVVVDGLWPSDVGPASHEEMLGWIDEQARVDAQVAKESPGIMRRRNALAAIAANPDLLDALASAIEREEGDR